MKIFGYKEKEMQVTKILEAAQVMDIASSHINQHVENSLVIREEIDKDFIKTSLHSVITQAKRALRELDK